MKRVLINYSFIMKDGRQGNSQCYASIEGVMPDQEVLLEARRDFYNDHGFFDCFDVLELEVTKWAVEE